MHIFHNIDTMECILSGSLSGVVATRASAVPSHLRAPIQSHAQAHYGPEHMLRSFRGWRREELGHAVCRAARWSTFAHRSNCELVGEDVHGSDPAVAARREPVSIGMRGWRETGRCALRNICECCERPCGGRERTVRSPLGCEVVVVAKIRARPRGIC